MSNETVQPIITQERSPDILLLPEISSFDVAVPTAVQRYFTSMCHLEIINPEEALIDGENEWETFQQLGMRDQGFRLYDYPDELCSNPHYAVSFTRCYSYEGTPDQGITVAEALRDSQYDLDIRKALLESARNRAHTIQQELDSNDIEPDESLNLKALHQELAVLHHFIVEIKQRKPHQK